MTATRSRDLLGIGIVVAVLANLAVRLSYGTLPSFPVLAGATLGVLGVAEVLAGRALRARILRRPGTRPIDPLVAARAVVVAKASSVSGAIMAGVWAGLLAHVLPLVGEVSAAGSDAVSAGVGLACALGLVAGGLWLEWCCRTPGDDLPGRDTTVARE